MSEYGLLIFHLTPPDGWPGYCVLGSPPYHGGYAGLSVLSVNWPGFLSTRLFMAHASGMGGTVGEAGTVAVGEAVGPVGAVASAVIVGAMVGVAVGATVGVAVGRGVSVAAGVLEQAASTSATENRVSDRRMFTAGSSSRGGG